MNRDTEDRKREGGRLKGSFSKEANFAHIETQCPLTLGSTIVTNPRGQGQLVSELAWTVPEAIISSFSCSANKCGKQAKQKALEPGAAPLSTAVHVCTGIT